MSGQVPAQRQGACSEIRQRRLLHRLPELELRYRLNVSAQPAYPLFQSGSLRFVPNRFTHQLVFDKSPYPPLKEWVESYGIGNLEGSLNYHHYWERTDFVRGAIDKSWTDFLDLGWWLSSSAGDGHVRGK